MPTNPVRPRNDLRQYDDLVEEWWRPDGAFAALHWLAAARAVLVGTPPAPGAQLLDVACGGGLLAPHLDPAWRHIGIDLVASGLGLAATHGVAAVQADAGRLPFRDGAFEAVVAGEVLEHVTDLDRVIAEICRVLAPDGMVVIDTIADTRWARFSLVTVAERLPGGPPPRCHDPGLFVDPRELQARFARNGVELLVRGLEPHPLDYARFILRRRGPVRMRPCRSLSALYQGVGRKHVDGAT